MISLKYRPSYGKTGSLFGYSYHSTTVKNKLLERGVIFDQDSKYSLDIFAPIEWEPDKGKVNILYTMWEYDTFPDCFAERISRADYIITPSHWNKEVFEEKINKPVYVVPLGFDETIYKYYERKKSDEFTFLYCGDLNYRKGIAQLLKSWDYFKEKYSAIYDKSKLLIKTTMDSGCGLVSDEGKNIFVDSRILPFRENDSGLPPLSSVYNYANAFVFPSMGEGWGLTLNEAMATGLPSIYTHYAGVTEWCDLFMGYAVDYWLHHGEVKIDNEKIVGCNFCDADPACVADAMAFVYRNYDKALERGKFASERLHSSYTWDQSVTKLIDVIKEIQRIDK